MMGYKPKSSRASGRCSSSAARSSKAGSASLRSSKTAARSCNRMDADLDPLHYPRCDQVTLTGRLSARYQGNLKYLEHIYATREDWMLEPFRYRGMDWVLEPLRNKKGELAWAGEYAGKWLDAAVLSASDTDEDQLGPAAARFAAEL